MKNFKILIFTFLILLSFSNKCFSQDYKNYIDPIWDSYYDRNPSGIESNYTASDFIKVIEYVNFVPRTKEFRGDSDLFKRVLLTFGFPNLRQMMITGDFYSRTIKHDDYYYLYNSYYSKIEKAKWDRFAPYLIPLMEIDGLIKLE